MFSRVISQKLAPLRRGVILGFNSSPTVVSLRQSSSKETPRDKDLHVTDKHLHVKAKDLHVVKDLHVEAREPISDSRNLLVVIDKIFHPDRLKKMNTEINTGNRHAHSFSLSPCLLNVDDDPAFELVFDALFGVSSKEAKALDQFNYTHLQIFEVDRILSEHAELWRYGIANTFIDPFHLWLNAMRQLLSQPNPKKIDHALLSSAQELVKEVLDKAAADFAVADAQGLSKPGRIEEELNREPSQGTTDPYHWDKIIADWDKRGLLYRLMVELEGEGSLSKLIDGLEGEIGTGKNLAKWMF